MRVRSRPPAGHVRTPAYVQGKTGEVTLYVGSYPNPELAAAGGDGRPWCPLYRVRFRQKDTWPDYVGNDADTLDVEIYEHWLEAIRQ